MDLPFYLLLNYYVSGKRHILLQRDGKILMKDSIYAFTSHSGGSRGGARPLLLFLDQTEARRAGKKIS